MKAGQITNVVRKKCLGGNYSQRARAGDLNSTAMEIVYEDSLLE